MLALPDLRVLLRIVARQSSDRKVGATMSPYTEAMKTIAVAKPVIDPSGSTIAVSTAIPAPMKIHILRRTWAFRIL